MSPSARDVLNDAASERDWQATVVEFALRHGWQVIHQLNSRGTTPGWPDLVLMRPPDLLYVELKTERGQLTLPQRRMLADLSRCGADARVARPSDAPVLFERLARRPLHAKSRS